MFVQNTQFDKKSNIERQGYLMCMPHQKPAKAQKKQIRGQKEKKHQPLNRNNLEHGDTEFKDERKKAAMPEIKKQGFFAKLFS